MTGEIAVLDRTGDTKIQWNKTDMNQVADARSKFVELLKKGYAMFRTNRQGDKGEQIHSFDPEEQRIIAVPPIVGG